MDGEKYRDSCLANSNKLATRFAKAGRRKSGPGVTRIIDRTLAAWLGSGLGPLGL